MIILNQIKIQITPGVEISSEKTLSVLRAKTVSSLRLRECDIDSVRIWKVSIDSRKKPQLFYVYSVAVFLKNVSVEKQKKICEKNPDATWKPDYCNELIKELPYIKSGVNDQKYPVYIIGCGPAGLFCAYYLTMCGYNVTVIERGAPIDERSGDVEEFWKTGVLKPDSNVLFGEGGAGTFSDGKLNTMVKDPDFKYRKMLEIFVKYGAPEDILYRSKPHIGTDELKKVIANMRKDMVEHGTKVLFHTCLTDIEICDGKLAKIQINNEQWLECEKMVLCTGHSARDTFAMLERKHHIKMEAKPFAVGMRVMHPQQMINDSQYGEANRNCPLPAADYKLTATASNTGRSVFSFCMCPGGYVVNASSEEGMLAVNGMSNHGRDSETANSALIVSVTPEDYGGDASDPLRGIAFQQKMEQKAYQLCGGKIPIQLLGDFLKHQKSVALGEVVPCIKGEYEFAQLHNIFPEYITDSIENVIDSFDRKIKGFGRSDAIFAGLESRTSSPVRILRDENMMSLSSAGLYPCGEGAGYAGGISSAAMDGMRVAQSIVKEYNMSKVQ